MEIIATLFRSRNQSNNVIVGMNDCALYQTTSKQSRKQVKKITAGQLLPIL